MKSSYPRSVLAPTARAKCLQCGKAIAANSVKIEVEQQVQTPRGTKATAASLHPECALAWVAASSFPGGKRVFCRSLATNGTIAIPDLAPTDLRPEGTTADLMAVFPQWGTTDNLDAIRSTLEGRAWSAGALTSMATVSRAFTNTAPEIRDAVVRALVAVAEPDERAAVAEAFFAYALLSPANEGLSLELLPACSNLSSTTIGPLLQYGTPTLLGAAAEKIAPRERGLAFIPLNPVAGRATPQMSDDVALRLLSGSDPEAERDGIHPIHAAVIQGLPRAAESLARHTPRPLGADLRLPSFANGPRLVRGGPDGQQLLQTELITLQLSKGSTPLDIIDAIIDSGARARADVESNPHYANASERTSRLDEIAQTLERYRATRDALRTAGAQTSPSNERAASLVDAAFDRLYAAIGRRGERPTLGVPSGRWAALQWHLQTAKDSFASLAEKQQHPFVRTALSPLSFDGFLGGRSVHLYNSSTETGWDWDSSANAIDRDTLSPAARAATTSNEPIGTRGTSLWLLSDDDRLIEVDVKTGAVTLHGPVDEVFASHLVA